MDIITGYTGTPHITAENDRDINIGIFGSKSYVLQTGTMLTAEISNNNEIKVRDGVIMHQGCAASIKKNTYDSVTINNGSQGMKRIDLLVARYEKQPETNVESLTLKVLQGTPVETSPQVPEHTEGDIQVGDTVADMPLYEVEIDGLNITEIRKVFQTMGDLESVNGKLENTFEEYSISPYTYTIYKFNHGNQKFAKIHGTWTGFLGGNPFNGFYQSSITNLGVLNSELGLQIKRIITQSFYFTSSEGALIFVGLTDLNIEANSINGTIQFLKSQQRNNCRLEWDIEVELL